MKEEKLLHKEKTDRSPLEKRYRDGCEHIGLNAKEEEKGGSEVVEITFAKGSKQPPETNEDNNSIENGIDPIAVWTGVDGLITMKEAINTPGEDAGDDMLRLLHISRGG